MNLQLLDSENIRISFRPHLPTTALPISFLKDEMQMRSIRSFLASSRDKIIAPPSLIFKYEGRVVSRGCYAPEFNFDSLRQYAQHALVSSCFGDPPSMIALGKRMGDGATLKDLQEQRNRLMPDKDSPILVVLHDPIFGGRKLAASKQGFQQVLRARIANLLLEYGMTLPMASKAVETLMESVGQQKIHHMLHQQSPTQRYSAFEKLWYENKIALPKQRAQKSKHASKYARNFQNDQVHASKHVPVEQYALEEGFFLTANGQSLPVLSQFSSIASGICLMNPEHAEQRISQGKC